MAWRIAGVAWRRLHRGVMAARRRGSAAAADGNENGAKSMRGGLAARKQRRLGRLTAG